MFCVFMLFPFIEKQNGCYIIVTIIIQIGLQLFTFFLAKSSF